MEMLFVGQQPANARAHVRVERQGRILALDAISSAPFARRQRRGVQRVLSDVAALGEAKASTLYPCSQDT